MKLTPASSVKSNSDSLKDNTTAGSVEPLSAPSAPSTSSRCLSLPTTKEYECAEIALKSSTKREKNKKSENAWWQTTIAGAEETKAIRTTQTWTLKRRQSSSATPLIKNQPTWTLSWCIQARMEISSTPSLVTFSYISIVTIKVRILHRSKWRISK